MSSKLAENLGQNSPRGSRVESVRSNRLYAFPGMEVTEEGLPFLCRWRIRICNRDGTRRAVPIRGLLLIDTSISGWIRGSRPKADEFHGTRRVSVQPEARHPADALAPSRASSCDVKSPHSESGATRNKELRKRTQSSQKNHTNSSTL